MAQKNADWKSFFLKTTDGAELHCFSALPKVQPKAIIHINHGMAEHAARYERFAQALTGAGYGVFAHDHRGHGHTTAPGAAQGHFAQSGGWGAVIGDVLAVNAEIKQHHPDVPIICLGHSMGSIITFNYILRHPDTIAGAALWNSGVEAGALLAILRSILKIQRMFKGSDVPSGFAQKASFETWNKKFAPNRTECDWLSRDEAEVDKYIADPLCGFDVTIGLWLDVLQGIHFAADDANLKSLPKTTPVHLQAGDEDPCTKNGKSVANIHSRMKSAGMNDVTFTLLKNNRHESLNELDRDETTRQFIQWLDDRFG